MNVKATVRNRGQQTDKIGKWQICSENSTSDTWETTVPLWELNRSLILSLIKSIVQGLTTFAYRNNTG